jgi:exodeoxyribonuclease V alpha subunit
MTTVFELNATDLHFAEFIQREAGIAPDWFRLTVSLASNAVGNGNICLNLADIAGKVIQVDGWDRSLPALTEMRERLSGIPVVGSPGEFRPLVLDAHGRLYLYRYWKYERELVRIILEKASLPVCALDEPLLGAGVGRLFPGTPGDEIDWQKVAALGALWKRFCVISGGPGTGKTSTVVKILALLLEQAKGETLHIALAAPTGKSAARLKESIRLMKEKLDCSAEVKSLIPEDVTTIHRLLGVRAGSVRFRYSEENLLPFSVVIVDEASMVALPLMAKLALALKPETRVILLGDRDQLASVEAGAALGDICGGDRPEPFSPGFRSFVGRVAGEKLPVITADNCDRFPYDSLTVLKKNYRFAAESGIGGAARAVNAGDGGSALRLLKDEGRHDIRWQDAPAPDQLKRALAERIVAGYSPYRAATTPEEALRLFDGFRVLTALRQGPYGVTGVNAIVEEILAEKGLIERHNRWYPGRPVMITVNDYNLKLFNGDIGIVFPDLEADGNTRVFFPAPDGGVRKVAPVRLPAHDTVYAMTIHKSQGSEFDRILMLLPEHDSEALTRELIYTGLTRAKRSVEIWGDQEVFRTAVSRRVERTSGLREALWGVVPGEL